MRITKEPSEEGEGRGKRGEGRRRGRGFFRHTLSISDGTRLLPTFCWTSQDGGSLSNEWKP